MQPGPLLDIASCVASLPGAAVVGDGLGTWFLSAWPCATATTVDPPAAAPCDPDLARSPEWIGVVPYEALRHLERPRWGRPREDRPEPHLLVPRWQRYGAVAKLDGQGLRVHGRDASAVRRLEHALGRAAPTASAALRLLADQEPVELHRARIERALELIARGDLYQVNVARRFDVEAQGRAVHLLGLLTRGRAWPRFAAAIDLGGIQLTSLSPELLLDWDPTTRQAQTTPIKGTRPATGVTAADAAAADELDRDPKERAELAMILDVERNDLGSVAEVGSVQLTEPPHVRLHGTVIHREATLAARVRPGVTRAQLLDALLPSGSVTGAPKRRAMEVIATLEGARRGLYTGAIGYACHDGGLRLSMAIRTLTTRAGVGHYFAGGGIVADSDPSREVEETRWKARQLFDAAGG